MKTVWLLMLFPQFAFSGGYGFVTESPHTSVTVVEIADKASCMTAAKVAVSRGVNANCVEVHKR